MKSVLSELLVSLFLVPLAVVLAISWVRRGRSLPPVTQLTIVLLSALFVLLASFVTPQPSQRGRRAILASALQSPATPSEVLDLLTEFGYETEYVYQDDLLTNSIVSRTPTSVVQELERLIPGAHTETDPSLDADLEVHIGLGTETEGLKMAILGPERSTAVPQLAARLEAFGISVTIYDRPRRSQTALFVRYLRQNPRGYDAAKLARLFLGCGLVNTIGRSVLYRLPGHHEVAVWLGRDSPESDCRVRER